jgi:putative FmdB family regulatory protein
VIESKFWWDARRVNLPLYEYKCLKCKRHTDKIEKVSGPHLKKCPHCGGKVESVVTAPSIKFKGSGWYVTDYAGKSSSGDGAKGEKTGGETKEAATKEGSGKEGAGKDSASKGTSEKKTAKKE